MREAALLLNDYLERSKICHNALSVGPNAAFFNILKLFPKTDTFQIEVLCYTVHS
jgi:hypothetical protein